MGPTDADRQHNLRRLKAVALCLLLAAAVVYVITTVGGGEGWVGYVQAFAEAAMVGALADWFAVTALFRHPLGLPIPHTAIIPNRKDQIGRSLGEFVESNFLTEEVLGQRIGDAAIGRRVGVWLSDPDRAAQAAQALGDTLAGALEILDDTSVQHGLETVVRGRIASTPAAPLVGRVIDLSVDDGHHQRLLDAVLTWFERFLDDHDDELRRQLYRRAPGWAPDIVNAKVFEKVYDVAKSIIDDVRSNPDHEIRASFHQSIVELGERLQHDPGMLANGERIKVELLDHPQFRSWIESLWAGSKQSIIDATADDTSELRLQIVAGLRQVGGRLATDRELQGKVDGWLHRAVGYVVGQYGSEAGDLIAATVERWDGESTAEKMELQVGRDLQFIRINGTLVGGIAGVLIHIVGQLL